MPVRDEERHLADSVACVLEQEYPGGFELVLAVGPSKDRTEAIARELAAADNRITVGNAGVDDYGVPIARIEFKYRENERRMMIEMYQSAAAILKEAKAEILPYDPTFMGIPGQAIHEHSTCRMGVDRKRSALNGFCQMHDVKNVFVVDGAAFTSASEKNPTLTILALAWRATDYLASEMKSSRL